MKRQVLFLFAFLVSFSCFAQLETWELSTEPGNQLSSAPNFTAANISTGTLLRGAGVTASAAAGCITSTGWFASATPTTLADAIANNDYYEFTLPVNAGFKANLTQVAMIVRSSNTGPNTGTLRSSADGFATNLGTIAITTASVLNNIPVSLSNITGTLTFRLYGYGSAANAASSPAVGGTMRIGTSVVALDNDLIITGTTASACNLTSAGLTDVHCENNAESGSATDDYIWFQLNPVGTGLGTGYNVTVNTGSVLLNGTTAATNVLYGSSNFFRLQQGSAGAGNVIVTITDATTGAACSIQVTIIDPGSCSQSFFCSLATSGLSGVACNNNGTSPNAADDYISFFLNPTGSNLTTYSLTVSSGTVTLFGGGAATGVAYGVSTQFRLQNGSAGGGNVTVFIADDEDADCVLSVPIVDPGSCSAPACSLMVSCPPQPLGTFNCNNPIPAAVTTQAGFTALGGSISGTLCGMLGITSTTTPINNCSSTSVTRVYTIFDDLAPFNGIKDGNETFFTCTLVYTYAPDQTPPTLTCPGPVTVSCANLVPAQNTASVTGLSDNCSGTPTVAFVSDNNSNQTCANRFTLTRIYKATDLCGNSATCSQLITVNDQTAPTFNPPLPPATLNISCTDNLPVAPMLTGSDNCAGGGAVPNVIFINEFHYDNTGADVGEFVEVAGTAGINLADYQIILYNGNGGVVYTTTPLSGVIDNEGSGFGAVSFSYPANGIQNGSPDGIALYRISTNMVIQFLSYEGVFQATDGPANGMFSVDVGVQELGTEAIGLSLQLTGTGQVASNFTWVGPIAQSPGTLNAGQTINPLPASIAATVVQTETPGACAGSRIVTRKWTVTDACGNSAMFTQTINVGDSQAPVLTPMPANVTISCSDPVPTAPAVIATDGCDPAGIVNGPVWINELHYDNAGTDANEFVEIAGRAGTNLSGYELFFYNGSTGNMGGTYGSLPLSGIIPNQSNGFGTIAFFLPVNGLENGPSDGIAFVKGGTVLQFLSYEGVMTAIGGPANGMVSTDIGVAEAGTEAPGQSLRLSGNGATYAAFVWNGPSVANPATPGQVNQGQTFPPQPPVGLAVTFNQTTSAPSPTCPFSYTISRTWSTTDACGNTAVYTQTITVQDVTPPTVNCPANVTVNLPISGMLSVTPASLGVTATDNCGTTTLSGSLALTCANQGQTLPFVSKATDQCGNMGTCTTQVFVAPFARCIPKILVSDPCVCKNNATTLTNGQFGETIKIESITGKIWTITAINGLYNAGSPAPPAAPIPIPVGTTFTENPAGSGDYFLTGIHIDAIGYTITVTSQAGEVLTIGNSCQYPNPTITSDLSGAFCINSNPVDLTGTPGDANIVSQGFTINGVPATQFNPAAGPGQYLITYTVNGGTPKAFGPNDPGCTQSVSQYVNVLATPSQLVCNDLLYISLDIDCVNEVLPDDVLEGTYGCYDDYIVEVDRTLPYGNGPWTPAVLGVADLGFTYQYRVTHLVSGNKCWGNLKLEDKFAPTIECSDIDLSCATVTYDPAYLFNVLNIDEAYPDVFDCTPTNLVYIDTWHDLACNQGFNGHPDLSAYVTRKWTVTDAWGNTATCIQYIYFERRHIGDVLFPSDVTISCSSSNINTNPSNTGAPYIDDFGFHISLFPNNTWCEMQAAYVDQILPVCDGTYKILRTWTVIDWCLPTTPFPPTSNPMYFIQLIKIIDDQGPAIACPANMTVSTDPFNCCATVDLPNAIVEDNCSRINNISAMVITYDPYTGDQGPMYIVGGTLTTFPGNNYWDLDTLGNWGYTPCLPQGTHTVVYTAEDDCGNTSTCSFRLTVRDYVAPVAACDEFTVVGIGTDDPFDCYTPADGCSGAGVTWVKATTFDDGSYDNCNNLHFTVRRMEPYSDCINNLEDCEKPNATQELDSIKFYCCEVGTIQTVILRVYQVDLNGQYINGPDGMPVYNECMVNVSVQDKIKPVCLPPANMTVACENFDPSLWVYGIPNIFDNCCLDTTKVYQNQCGLTHTVNYSLFDTVCNKGTIVRTFRAFDCHGLSSQCTQRIVVNYNQNYFVKFPNDVIVTTCDGTGNYGEPTFFGKDCELLGVNYEDQIFTVVPDACFKIERTWTIINWCTYNPNLPCIEVPNPNPNPIANHPSNLPGPTVSACGTLPPWAPTVVKINPTDPTATNYCTFWDANANCYKYKQIIKIIDGVAPVVDCPASPVEFCDLTPNNPLLWNETYWWDNVIGSHDLCEGPADLCITGSDACSGANITIHYLLFLDLDADGVMETVINSINTGIAGLGWNTVNFGNAGNPNFSGGTPRAFDERAVPANQKYGFAIQNTVSGNNKTACVRWNTQQSQTTYVVPELPYGTHKIKWFVEDGCGNQNVCEYTFIVKDCKKPTVVCLNGLSVNIMPTGMITLWASDFLQYGDDNCTPANQLKYGIRKSGTGTGFPVDANGNPITSVTFTCDELGTQLVELWAIDKAGNADYCETYVIVQDNMGNCGPISGAAQVAGVLSTEATNGVSDGSVGIAGGGAGIPNFNFTDMSDNAGHYGFNAIPTASSSTVTPVKDDNPLNGVSTYDLVLISKHILGLQPLNTPYKMIAADANKNNSITTTDIVEFRKLILGIYTELPNNTSWRFVDADFAFPNPANPFSTTFPENKTIANIQANQMGEDFVSVKIGDVNGSAIANATMSADDRSTGTLLFDVEDRDVKAGETFTLNFKAAERVQGYQFTMNFQNLEVVDVTPGANMKLENFGVFADLSAVGSPKEGAITTSFDGDVQGEFGVTFRAAKAGKISKLLSVSSQITRAEAYSNSNEKLDVAFRFNNGGISTISGVGFELYQNQPNPFVNKTFIGFHLPTATEATLTIYDETGRMLFTQKGDYAKGYNSIAIDRALISTTGVLYYKLETATDSATKKMIQTK